MKGIDADPNAPESLKKIVNSVLDVIDNTVKQGRTDIGATVVLAPESFRFVSGVRVADGRALAEAFQQLFELARHDPHVPEVKFYAARHHDVDLHTFTVPIAEREKDTRKMLGEQLDVVVGTGTESLYFAFGPGSEELLKTVIDRSLANGEQPVPPVHLRVALKPLLRFLASIDTDDPKRRAMAAIIEQSRGGDEVSLTINPIDNGIGCRLQIDEGVLEVLGKVSQKPAGGF